MFGIEFRQADVRDVTFLVPLIGEASGGVWPAVWHARVTREGPREGQVVQVSSSLVMR